MPVPASPRVIPQWIDGIRYRSSLEARWAIFFREAGIRAEYEPEGFVIGDRPYRPDFLLPGCGTWVEVKGDPGRLDMQLMTSAAAALPGAPLLILGHIPSVVGHEDAGGPPDWGWIGLHPELAGPPDGEPYMQAGYYGFGCYHKNGRLWWHSWAETVTAGMALDPVLNEYEPCDPEIRGAYAAARAHRFGR